MSRNKRNGSKVTAESTPQRQRRGRTHRQTTGDQMNLLLRAVTRQIDW